MYVSNNRPFYHHLIAIYIQSVAHISWNDFVEMRDMSLILDTRFADFPSRHPRASIRFGTLDIESFHKIRSKFPEFYLIIFYDSAKDLEVLKEVCICK
jgi:hypothetical protein